MSELDESKALVRRYFEEFFNDRALDGAADVCAAEYVEHAVAPFGDSEPGAVNGPDHARQTVAWLTEQFPDVRMDIEALISRRRSGGRTRALLRDQHRQAQRGDAAHGTELQRPPDTLVPGGRRPAGGTLGDARGPSGDDPARRDPAAGGAWPPGRDAAPPGYPAVRFRFSATRNSTIRRMRSTGRGSPSGNCAEPLPLLYGASSSANAVIALGIG